MTGVLAGRKVDRTLTLRRCAARLVDDAVVLGIEVIGFMVAAVAAALAEVARNPQGARALAVVVAATGVAAAVGYEVMGIRVGGTMGMSLWRLRVVDRGSGRWPSWGQALVRGLLVSGLWPLLLAGLWAGGSAPGTVTVIVVALTLVPVAWRFVLLAALVREAPDSLHDRWAGTWVVAATQR
jgi:uncharacterized RDD family membrane protein YckC